MSISRESLANTWGAGIQYYLQYRKEIYVAPGSIRAIRSPRVLTFLLRLVDSADVKKVKGLETELALELGTKSCRISTYYGEVVFEVPLPKSLWGYIPATTVPRKRRLCLMLGYTTRMTPVYCHLDGNEIAPILFAGKTGAGKTEALKLIVWELADQNIPEDLQFVIYDPKGKFKLLERLPHLAMPILRTPQGGLLAGQWLVDQLHARMAGQQPNQPRYVFIIDEVIDLIQHNEELAAFVLGDLARLGREFAIHTIYATQRPDRKHLDKLTAANIGLRIVGRVPDPVEASVACGRGGTGVHLLQGAGDMLMLPSGDEAYRIQIALVPDAALEALPKMDAPPPMPELVDKVNPLSDFYVDPTVPFKPVELAVALTDVGIGKLKTALHLGQDRATELRQEWAMPTLQVLKELGYGICKEEEYVESIKGPNNSQNTDN